MADQLGSRKLLKTFLLLGLVSVAASLLASPALCQSLTSERPILWKKTLTAAAKGTRISLPKAILDEIEADPDNCLDPRPGDTVKADGYRARRRNLVLIVVWGKSSCFCSPTGNCQFWIFQSRHGKYEAVLQTGMVREFGFLPTATNGLPDVVLWSHDSGQRFPGALWKFNGREYAAECSWEIVSSYKDVANGGIAEWEESHVESNSCNLKLIPEREKPKRQDTPRK